MYILDIILGAILLSVGANFLTDGAAAVAKRLKVSEFLIGATIVAVGTSMPELVVSVLSAIEGKSDVAIGNIVGSNTFNILAILGVTSLITPLALTSDNIRRDIPLCLGTTVLLCLLALDKTIWGGAADTIGRGDGILMLLLYGVMLWYMIRSGRKGADAPKPADKKTEPPSAWLSIVMIVGGFVGLVFGADMFLDGSIILARKAGVSEAAIALVLVAGGTSLPELFASVVSALKGKTEIALGNILGSNIANILLILGLSSTIRPLALGGVTVTDMAVMLGAAVAVLLTAFTFRRRQIDRVEGVLFLAAYITYTVLLLG